MAKDAKTIREELARPFAPEDLEWRIQVTTKDKTSGLAIPYVTNRAIQDRLDEVVGPENWYNDYKSRGTETERRTRRSAAFPSTLRAKASLQNGTVRRIRTSNPSKAVCPTR